MDLVLNIADKYFFDAVYAQLVPVSAFGSPSSNDWSWNHLVSYLPHPPLFDDSLYVSSSLNASLHSLPSSVASISAWPRSYIPRQLLTLFVLTLIGIHVLYFVFAYLSYAFIFNHEMMRHPRFLDNQVRLEIMASLKAFPVMTLLTLPWFEAEVRGYSRLYEDVDTYGWTYLVLSVPFFLLFTDYCIYWVHRFLHHPLIYKPLHKPHHKWIIPTPFASHAFHPVDGYFQSVPYHLFIFLFPMHRVLYLGLFVAVNFWSIFIHDSDMITGHPLEKIINGPAHHTLHHIYFTVNYGQYFTWADRVGNSYRHPEASLDPLLEVKMRERGEREKREEAEAKAAKKGGKAQ